MDDGRGRGGIRAGRDARIRRTVARSDPRAAWDRSMINNQRRYPSDAGTFGRLGSMSENGCGFMAIHNANQLLGEDTTFQDTYAALQKRSLRTASFFGLFGTNPFEIGRYFREKGCRVRLYRDPERVLLTHDAYIALYLYREKRGLGAHYVAARYVPETGRFTIFNDDFEREVERTCRDFSEMRALDRAFGMLVWGIDRP